MMKKPMRSKSLGVNLLILGSRGADRDDPGMPAILDPQYSIQSATKLHVIGVAVKRAGRAQTWLACGFSDGAAARRFVR
jgi:hypothetical protein